MNNIYITRTMYDDIKDLKYESQVNIVMAFLKYLFDGNIENFDLSEVELYIFNKWVDDELSRDG